MDEVTRRDCVIATERRIFNRAWNHAKRTGEFGEVDCLGEETFDEYEAALEPCERYVDPSKERPNLILPALLITLLRRKSE